MQIGKKKHSIDNLFDALVLEPAAASYPENYPTSKRTFAFVDVTNYTAYTQKYGSHAAAQMLHKFRSAVRVVVGRHGIRVAKWLGDGVMLVGIKSTPVFEAVAELTRLFKDEEFSIHSGIASGSILIFEGDDYIGKAVNIASRLAEHADPSEILAHNIHRRELPNTVKIEKTPKAIQVKGIGELSNVYSLHVNGC